MTCPGNVDHATSDDLADVLRGDGSVEIDGPALTANRGAPVRFLLATSLSAYGDWLSAVAIVVLLFQLTGSYTASAGYTVVRVAPRLLGSGPGGAMVDRHSPVRIVVIGSAIQAVLAALLIAAAMAGLPVLIYVAVGLSQFVSSATRPAHPAVIARLMTTEKLRNTANALYGGGLSSSVLVAPALGALLLNITTPQSLIALDGLTFCGVIALLVGISTPGATVRGAPGVRSGLAEGARVLVRGRALRLLAVATVCGALTITATQALLIAAAADRFGGAQNVGWMYSGVGAGAVMGAFAAGRWRARVLTSRRVLFAFLGEICGLAIFAVSPTLGAAVLFLGLSSASGLLYDTWGMSEIQRVVNPDAVGRTFGALFQALNVGLAIGAVVGLVFISVVPWSVVIIGCAAVSAALGVLAHVAPISARYPES